MSHILIVFECVALSEKQGIAQGTFTYLNIAIIFLKMMSTVC